MTGDRLAEAVAAVDAPDVVFALSRDGRRSVRCGGSGPAPCMPRDELRYEAGSASKSFTALLLTSLSAAGVVHGRDPALAHLAPGRPAGGDPVRLVHLMTHTSGLPALPADLYPRAVPRWSSNPFQRYGPDRVVAAFLRARPRHRPGGHWRYSNFGVSVLGHALSAAAGAPWQELMTRRLLGPLGLAHTSTLATPGADAAGHRKDGATPTPPLDVGGFLAAGAIRATPHDLLTFLEAHLEPERVPDALTRQALTLMRRPVLRRGHGHRHIHSLGWFVHPTGSGPAYFHAGATSGQQAFLGFRPGTGTAVAAVATRRFRRGDGFVAAAYALLTDDEPDGGRHR
ncbi:serine hydrolase domain-containing protein [Streptomyces sp. SL13]|uniref:Serine hydrolase domain-containing protein n=1 Tax=Streptantibioticus silvisoli TaxID=2705255 RepID=A0AA90JW44_9ACTN|nr:serine hydrolase domain-containing protein [Streptantibioticus silvisoli]MDI5968546.1 serine hydrolase domain-containing protein [Streptantibioticus silvisoli]